MAVKVNREMPTVFPTTSPRITPSATGDVTASAIEMPRKSTPALARANKGTTTNELHPTSRVSTRVRGDTDSLAISLSSMASWSACSRFRAPVVGELVDYGSDPPIQFLRAYMGWAGVSRPSATPARVAWTPDSSMKYQAIKAEGT